jgi:hypothetical protein
MGTRLVLAVAASLLIAAPAAAQTAPRLPRGDASLSLGWLHAEVSALSHGQDNWAGSRVTLAGQAGFYWTEHLKTEVIAERSSRQDVWEGENIFLLDGRTAWRNGQHDIQDTRLSVGQFYQFGHNAWAHVSIGAGVSVTRRDVASEVFPLIVYDRTGQQALEPGYTRTSQDTRTNAFAAAALKAYVTPRVFFRSDVQADFRSSLNLVTVRAGMGVDF